MISNGLHPIMRPAAELAERFGLHLANYNSGHPRNDANGFRLFYGTDLRDFFDGGHIVHLKTKSEVDAFLAGFSANK